jgi:hypothetical protein
MEQLIADYVWVVPAAVAAVGSVVIAVLATRVASRADALRARLVEVPTLRAPLRDVQGELYRVRTTVEDRHRR